MLLGMTKLVAVGALGHQAINDMTGIGKAFKVGFWGLRPDRTVLTTSRLVRGLPGDTVSLLEIALRIHQDLGRLSLLLDSDEIDRDVQLAECLLKLNIVNIRQCLHVLLSCQLGVDDFTILSGLDELLPRLLGGDVWNAWPDALAGIFTSKNAMT